MVIPPFLYRVRGQRSCPLCQGANRLPLLVVPDFSIAYYDIIRKKPCAAAGVIDTVLKKVV